MLYHCRPVDSGQKGIHRRLHEVLSAHLHTQFKKPISGYSRSLFTGVDKLRRSLNKPVILDSGCGTGSATRVLAKNNPNALVIGIDKSAHRLARGGTEAILEHDDNLILLRMDLVDFWRLALLHCWQIKEHYLLYPNPWPKAKHLRRRWHGHPVFPQLLALGGKLELRSNWRVYAQEFESAVNYIVPDSCKLSEFEASNYLSLFEKKYSASGHKLYQCLCDLDVLGKINQVNGGLQPVFPSASSHQQLIDTHRYL